MSTRINAYCSPAPDGAGVRVDIEGMAVDLAMACKAGRIGREDFLAMMAQIYDDTNVTVKRPSDH